MSYLQGGSIVTEQGRKAQSEKDEYIKTLKEVIRERIALGGVTITNLSDSFPEYNEIDVRAALWYLLDQNEAVIKHGAFSTPR